MLFSRTRRRTAERCRLQLFSFRYVPENVIAICTEIAAPPGTRLSPILANGNSIAVNGFDQNVCSESTQKPNHQQGHQESWIAKDPKVFPERALLRHCRPSQQPSLLLHRSNDGPDEPVPWILLDRPACPEAATGIVTPDREA